MRYKNRTVRLAIELGIIVAVFLLLKTWLQRDLVKGTPPSLQGKLLNGRHFDMQTLRGKPALIHFWASWCGICKLEQSSINAISKDYTVVSVAMNSGTAEEVSRYMAENQLTFPVINDPTGAIAERYGVRAVPASFILNPQGTISFKETGYTSNWGLRIRLWLAGD